MMQRVRTILFMFYNFWSVLLLNPKYILKAKFYINKRLMANYYLEPLQ